MVRTRSHRKHLTYPVWVVLVVVVLFPVFGLTKGVVDQGLASRDAAEEAAWLDSQVQTVSSLQLLNLLLLTNEMSEYALLAIEDTGLDLEILFPDDENLAITLGRMTESRDRVRAAAEALRLDDPNGPGRVLGEERVVLRDKIASLAPLYEQLDSGDARPEDIEATTQSLIQLIDVLASRVLGDVRARSSNTDLQDDIRAVDSLMLSFRASIDELVAVASLSFPGGLNVPGSGEPAAVVASSYAIGNHERNQFRLIAPRTLLDRWEALNDQADSQRLTEIRKSLPALVGLVPDAEGAARFDLIEYVGLVLAEMDIATTLLLPQSLVDVSAELVEARIQLEGEAQRSFVEAVIWMLVTMAVVILASRLLLRPLRLTSDRARDLTMGSVGEAPLGPMGPREINDVGVALDEAHASLHLLRDQLEALSDKRLDSPVLDRKVPGQIGEYVSQSVQSLSEATSRLHDQARTDRLTGLPNRVASVEALRSAAGKATRSRPTAVIFIDLDRFKAANDSYGHSIGDRVLQVASERFRAVLAECGETGSIGRLGGDEFLAVCPNVENGEEAERIAAALVAAMVEPIAVDAIEVHVGASAGVTIANGQVEEPSELLYEADLALYAAKSQGVGVASCSPGIKNAAVDKRHISTALAAALETPAISLHLQPLVDLDTSEIVAAEALMRWSHEGIEMSPGWFIPLVESSTLIIDVGRWVLAEAARMAAQLKCDVGREIPISVNISWNHVTSGSLLNDVEAAIKNAGIAPSQLRLELTETTPPNDVDRAAKVLSQVRELGVSLWLDDFGTGFTSITQLRDFAFDVIKLDRSFVAEESVGENGSLAVALIEIARLVDVDVIAEGVEEPEQAERMRSAGCCWGQGWLWSKALDLGEFVTLAKERTPLAAR